MTEKTVLKSSVIYNDDKSKRYLMNIEWDKTKKKATVIEKLKAFFERFFGISR